MENKLEKNLYLKLLSRIFNDSIKFTEKEWIEIGTHCNFIGEDKVMNDLTTQVTNQFSEKQNNGGTINFSKIKEKYDQINEKVEKYAEIFNYNCTKLAYSKNSASKLDDFISWINKQDGGANVLNKDELGDLLFNFIIDNSEYVMKKNYGKQ